MEPTMQRPFRFFVVLLILAETPRANAQSTLTMAQAVRQALARAPELGAAREEEEAAQQRVAQAASAYLPRLSAEASYSVHWPKNELPIELPPTAGMPKIGEIDDFHRVSAGASMGLRVLDLSRGPRLDAAKQSLQVERAKTQEIAAVLAFQVRATFLAAIFARDLQRISQESLRLALEEEKRAILRTEVGTGSQLALAQVRVRLAGLRAQYKQAESELERHRKQLASLLGMDRLPELQGDLEGLAHGSEKGDLRAAPQLERLRAARQASALSARSMDRTFLPTLGLMAKADYEYPHAMKLEWGPSLQAGVSLIWDFFDGGLRRGQTAEAHARSHNLEAASRATEESLRRKLVDLESKCKTAQADLDSAKETLKQTEIYLRVARGAVGAGTGTELDVHNAELGVDRSRIAVSQALLALALARAEMLMVYGDASTGGSR
jgi:outer membrane protein TolC